jgi:hypothetical protein
MKSADLIVLCHTVNPNIFKFQKQMLESFLKNTPVECKMLVVENNSTPMQHKDWKELVLSSNQSFYYSDEPFNMNRYYNIATKMTNNEYIIYCNSDLIYHEMWYQNLIEWFDIINNLAVITPFAKAFENDNAPEILNETSVYRKNLNYVDRFIDTVHLGGWFGCFTRKLNWRWDENFKAHYQDADMVRTFMQMREEDPTIITGIAYNSRVDHMVGGTSKNTSGVDYYTADGRKQMIKKWGGW